MTDPIVDRAYRERRIYRCFTCGQFYFGKNLFWHIRKVHQSQNTRPGAGQ